jgi:hypothetical protein
MQPVIFFREKNQAKEEIEQAKQFFPYYNSRVLIPEASLVIGRYSCLPFYDELERDVHHLKSQLINSGFQHDYIASFDYYWDIEPYTFKTWFSLSDVPYGKREKPLVVKGRTNSKKSQWNKMMFAQNFSQAVHIGAELMLDPTIGEQGIIVREYVELETFEKGINEMPMTNEWRLFFYRNELLAYGYYWGEILDNQEPVKIAQIEFEATGITFAKEVATLISDFTNFFVLDIARTCDGRWLVVEVNDGQQSGLNSTVSPETLYSNLAHALTLQS